MMKKIVLIIALVLTGFVFTSHMRSQTVLACDADCNAVIPLDPPPHDPGKDPLPAIYQNLVPDAPINYSVEDLINNCKAHQCDAHTIDVITALGNKYLISATHGFRLLYGPDGSIVLECVNLWWFIVKNPSACGTACTTKAQCVGAKDGCTECNSSGVCTGIAACGTQCKTPADCGSAKDGCTACIGGSCKPAPKCGDDCVADPTVCKQNVTGCNSCLKNTTGSGPASTCQPPAACGADCTADPNVCGTVVNVPGCNKCLTDQTGDGTKKTCQTTPACGADCSKDASACSLAGGCSQCVDHGAGVKKCEKPIACGSDCSGDPNVCKQASGGCNVCFKNSCTQDLFNAAMCKCDGTDTNVDSTIMLTDQHITITGFAKVEGGDTNWAKIKDMTFTLQKGNQEIAKSDPIVATIDSQTADKVRYKAVWNMKLPTTVQTGDKFQVTVSTNCQRQILATLQLAKKPSQTIILGMKTEPNSTLARLASFIKKTVGINILGEKVLAVDQLQIKSFRPVAVTKSCQSINFQF